MRIGTCARAARPPSQRRSRRWPPPPPLWSHTCLNSDLGRFCMVEPPNFPRLYTLLRRRLRIGTCASAARSAGSAGRAGRTNWASEIPHEWRRGRDQWCDSSPGQVAFAPAQECPIAGVRQRGESVSQPFPATSRTTPQTTRTRTRTRRTNFFMRGV